MLIEILGRRNYASEVVSFMQSHGIHKVIGFSGGADDRLQGVPEDDDLQLKYVAFRKAFHDRLISDALRLLRGYRVAILTGGTEGGIPELATRKAKEYGFKTIGVFPRKGKKYALDSCLLDLSICVDPMIGEARWGDEGATWTSLIDGMIVIGGSAGTLTECAHIQKINESLIKNNETPKYIVAIYGTGGTAEQLPHLWAKPNVRNVCMPMNRIYTGREASQYLIEKLALDDYFDPRIQSTQIDQGELI
jgi:predicted Rossmann-fold nucleotide-binding protein